MRVLRLSLVLACCALLGACLVKKPTDPDAEDGGVWIPIDPENPSYDGPAATDIVAQAIDDAVRLTWRPNKEGIASYTCHLWNIDQEREWTMLVAPKSELSCKFDSLDDGKYTYWIIARESTGNETKDPVVDTVDVAAITDPTIYLYPRSPEIEVGEPFTVELRAANFEPGEVKAIEAKIELDDGIVLTEVEEGTFLGDNVLLYRNLYVTPALVYLSYAGDAGAASDSNGVVATLTFTTQSVRDGAEIGLVTQARDTDNDSVDHEFRGARVEVVE